MTQTTTGRSFKALTGFVSIYGLLIVFALVLIVFSALRPNTFLSSGNIGNLLTSQSITALLAFAVMLPLTTGRFDMSVGYHIGLAHVLMIGLQVNAAVPWPLAALIVLAAGLVIGLINGLLVTRFKIDAFIATMGMGSLLYGVSNWYTDGQQIPGFSLPDSFTGLTGFVHGVPVTALYVAVVGIILWVILERMPVGRGLYVIGSNARAAELSGISVPNYVLGAFIGSGLLCALAGILLASILRAATPSVGAEYLLPAFAGVLLGATSIKPGRVNVLGTLLAVLVLAFSFSGVQQLGAAFYVEYFFNGGILIIAVSLSVYAANRRRKEAVAASS
ncbi:ABC transporter permease [Ancylobacter pratisalsi]|uniref:ABC transporter permease n=1 Tax=Ancylobacter pratisalsi TaxID=1745854 RepID=A0A6P1YSA7_9HYPH|nr:ABC transporter permease [Ancylobacter pratisalsi]QIB34584.1 ABC transporter permease [Ancylobacter pratisalsi]